MIQIATHDFCLLIQIYKISKNNKTFPRSLINFLRDDKVLKLGVNTSGDSDWLKKSYDIECDGLFDLNMLASKKYYVASSLLALGNMFSDLKLDKSKRKLMGYDFDASSLKPASIKYAAEDAFSAIQIYENLLVDKVNRIFLDYEKNHPMTVEEEDAELYKILEPQLIKGMVY